MNWTELNWTHNSKHKYVEKYIIIIITVICDHDAVNAKKLMSRWLRVKILIDTFN